MDSNTKAEAVVLRLRKLHQQTLKLDESYQNVSSNPTQRSSASRIKKTSNGKYLQPQIPPATKQDDILKTSKKTKKEFDIDSDLFSYDSRAEPKQKAYQAKKKPVSSNDMSNQRPPFSNARKNLISTIEDTAKPSNQRQPSLNSRKNQFSNIDETNKQPVSKPPFSAGKVNYSSATNDTYAASKQKSKLVNRTVKNSINNLNIKKNDQPKKQDQPIRKQSLSKKTDQPTKTEISTSIVNRNYTYRRKNPNEETEVNPTKQQVGVVKAAKEVERNPKSSRFANLRSNTKEALNDDIPSYDFKTRQTDPIQNIIVNRTDKINEAYKKVPQAQTITTTTNDEYFDPDDEILRQAAAFLRNRKKKETNSSSSSSVLQKYSSPVKKNPTSRVQQKNEPFSWGNALKLINDDDSSNSGSISNKNNLSKVSNNNNFAYKDDNGESDELNLFFTPEKDLSKGIKNNSKRSVYSNSNLKATLLDESDSASLGNYDSMNMKNEVYLSESSETEIVPDPLYQAGNRYEPKDQFVNRMRKKLDNVLNSDSTELSANSDIDRPEVNRSITISKGNNNPIYSDSINSDESDNIFSNQQQFSVIKNPNSKMSSIKNYGKVSSSNLSRFAQNSIQSGHQIAFSSEADDYLSSDSKNEELFSITEKRKDDATIIKSRNTKFNKNQNQGKLTVEQIKKNYIDISADNSSTKSTEYEEFPDLIISNKSPKKAIKEFNIVKNAVLNDIQSSDSSSPEVLKFYSNKNSLSNSNEFLKNNTEGNTVKNAKYDPFNTSKYSSIVLSEFDDSQENFNFEENSNTIDDDDEIPTVKKPPKPESQIKATTVNRNQFAQQENSNTDEDENEYDKTSEMAKSPQVEPHITPKKSANLKQFAQQNYLKIADFEEDEIDDDEIPAMKKPLQPESQTASVSNQLIQQKNPEIKNDEDESDDDDEIPAIKKPPQPEPLNKLLDTKSPNKKHIDQQDVENIEDDEEEDDDDYGIPVAKKPPQPEPQITSIATEKASSNKDQVDNQKIDDIDDYKDDIPIPQFDILSNKKDSNEKTMNLNKPKQDNVNSAIDLDSDDDTEDVNSKIEKKKSSPLRVSPPIGFTYFSKVNKNDKFQPLQFDDDNQLNENNISSDKEQKIDDDDDDEKVKIDQKNENHSFENDTNDESADDSFDEKLKMARNTISKIKGNQQKGQKSFDLFRNNSVEEEEKLEIDNLNEEEEEEEKNITISKKEEENQIQQSNKDKKLFQINSNEDDDLIQNLIESSSSKSNKQLHNDNISDDDDDIGTSFNSSNNKGKKESQIDNIDDDFDNFDGKKIKSGNVKSSNKELSQFKSDKKIVNVKDKSDNAKQIKHEIVVSDDENEEDDEQFKLNDISNKKESNPIKIGDIETEEESDEDRFKFDNIESDNTKEDIEKNKLGFKEEENSENEETYVDTKIENLFNKKSITSSNIGNDQNQVIINKIENENKEEEEDGDDNIKNNDIIINPKIELEEDEEDPIDPYFLDTNISDDSSDLKENHDIKEETTKKVATLNETNLEKNQNHENSDDLDIDDFEKLKRNFLNQEYKLDDENEIDEKEEEEDDGIINSNKEQGIKPSNSRKEIVSNILNGKEQSENEIEIDDANDDDEEEDRVLQRLKKFYSQNKVATTSKNDNTETIASNLPKTEDKPSNNKNDQLDLLSIEIEEEEDEEDGIVLAEKTSNFAHLPNKIDILGDDDDEEDNDEEIDTVSKTIKAPTENEQNLSDLPAKPEKQENKKYADLSESSSALDFLNQEDFLEDRLFLYKNKNIKDSISNQKNSEKEENDSIKNSVPGKSSNEARSMQLIKKAESLLYEEEEEDEIEEKNSIQLSNVIKSKEAISKITNNRIQIDKEEEEEEISTYKAIDKEEEGDEIKANKVIDPSKNTELKSKLAATLPQFDDNDVNKSQLQKRNDINPTLSGIKNQNETVEYEYEYEEEILEQISISNDETLTKPLNKPPVENKENESQNQSKPQNEKENSQNQQNEINETNPKHTSIVIKNETVEYEYEYEEEIIEQPQKSPIETTGIELKQNQPVINVKQEEKVLPQKENEIPTKILGSQVQKQDVEYEYEYEEEIIEQPQHNNDIISPKLKNNQPQIDKKLVIKTVDNIKEIEGDDDDAIIQRLQNIKGLNFNSNDQNDLIMNDLIDEEEEDISDDSLIKRLDQGISLMGKEIDDENGDENGFDDIDGDILQKRMQDFLNLPISDDDDDKDENSLLEKDV